ncbi:MAG: hypothetical protein GWN58_60540 [Anaerolineae bacterium]|nr:hypothetical protein [Anaerolineae bacterium]
MVPHLERMKVGDIEGPVETPRGIFLFKLVDREPARLMSLQEATPAIERILLKQKKEATLKGWFMQQREKYPVKVYVADLDRIGREQ